MAVITFCHKASWLAKLACTSLRASWAKAQIGAFAVEHDISIVGTLVENESGAKLTRPKLFRLIGDGKRDDVLLIDQVDRLSRLTDADWRRLRNELATRQIRVVALDLLT